MNRSINLLPLANRCRFAHLQHARLWAIRWLVVVGALLAVQVSLEYTRREVSTKLAAAEVALGPLRKAEADARRMLRAGDEISLRVRACREMEQSDAPLAILQLVGDCCRKVEFKVALESLRMDEVTTPASSSSPVPQIHKQVMMVGTADNDGSLAAFVDELRASRLFTQVDLEASHAKSELKQSLRSFQLRCLQ